jgi:hypothetical protein
MTKGRGVERRGCILMIQLEGIRCVGCESVSVIQAPLMNEWLAPLQIRPVRGSYMTLLEKDTLVI